MVKLYIVNTVYTRVTRVRICARLYFFGKGINLPLSEHKIAINGCKTLLGILKKLKRKTKKKVYYEIL